MILLEGMEFYAYHGHFKEEQIVGNKFLVDLEIDADCSKAAKSDNLKDAINYAKVYQLIKREMEQKSYLLEHIAQRIIDIIFLHFIEVQQVKVKVSKMNPPLGGKVEKVSVVLIGNAFSKSENKV